MHGAFRVLGIGRRRRVVAVPGARGVARDPRIREGAGGQQPVASGDGLRGPGGGVGEHPLELADRLVAELEMRHRHRQRVVQAQVVRLLGDRLSEQPRCRDPVAAIERPEALGDDVGLVLGRGRTAAGGEG